MTDLRPELTPEQLLLACADGELEADQQADVFHRLANDPAAARVVEDQARLRSCCRRTHADVEGPSEELARRVAAMAFQMPAEQPAERPSRSREFWRIGAASAVAAAVGFVAAGVLVGRLGLAPEGDRNSAGTGGVVAPIAPVTRETRDDRTIFVLGSDGITPRRSIIPTKYISALSSTHVNCAKHLQNHAATWPTELNGLKGPMLAYLGGDHPYPDLSKVGYRYVGCAACATPTEVGQKAVHLMYLGDSAADAISLFIEPDNGQVPFETGQCHGCGVPNSPHPMLAWKSGGLVFYLVGNGRDSVSKVREALQLPKPKAP